MAGTPYMVLRGIVLRETETKETDKILTLLTAERGKISAIARGARRKNCKFAAGAQSLAYSEWTLCQRGQWYYVNEGSSVELFPGLRQDLDAMALGFYFAELTEAVTAEETPAEDKETVKPAKISKSTKTAKSAKPAKKSRTKKQ